MAPPMPIFHLSTLSDQVNTLPSGKPRKDKINLEKCALKEMLQYKCDLQKPTATSGERLIVCEPVRRWYRQCANGLHVETTAWESWRAEQDAKRKVEA